MTYCYRCPNAKCGATAETQECAAPKCKGTDGPHLFTLRMVRDYRAEAVGIGTGVRETRRDDDLAL